MLTLFYHPFACSLGAQIALLEAGVKHDMVKIDLMGDRTEYFKINPLGTVPALQTEQGVVTESTAIMGWLAMTYPNANILPSDAFGFASGLSFLTWLASTAHIVRRQAKFPMRYTTDASGHDAVKESGAKQFGACLTRIDGLLAAQDYIMGGSEPNACDYQLMAYANWCAADGIDTSGYPNFERWRAQMLQRPAVQEALKTIGSALVA